MFFFISHIISWIIAPLSQILIALGAAFFTRQPAWKKRFYILTLALFVIYSSPITSSIALRMWEVPATPFREVEQTYDIGIVLCGMTSMLAVPDDRPHFSEGVDRITDAILLYKKGKVKKILISGGSGYLLFPDLKESERLKDFVIEIGVASTDVIVENKSDNTRQNAQLSMEIIRDQYPEATLMLITSGTHMRRALGCFHKVGANPAVFSTDIQTSPFSWDFRLLIPSASAVVTWSNLIREWAGYVVYWMAGYL